METEWQNLFLVSYPKQRPKFHSKNAQIFISVIYNHLQGFVTSFTMFFESKFTSFTVFFRAEFTSFAEFCFMGKGLGSFIWIILLFMI